MKYSKELKIGLFVVVIFVATFFVINYLRGKDLLNRETEVVSYFEDIQGLEESAPVFVKGDKAGQVSVIEYLPDEDRFSVTCSVRNEFNIPVDSKMVIYAVDIMGGKGVKIEFGDSDTYAEDGTELEPAYEAGLIDSIAGQAGELITKVNGTLDSLSVTIQGVNTLLGEANQTRISNTLLHLEATVKSVSEVAASIKGNTDEIDRFINDLVTLSGRLIDVVEKADTTIDGVNEAVGTVNEKISDVDLKGVVDSFHALLENINDPDGTVGKLLNDGSIYESLDSLLIDINSLVRKIEENPKKYMKLSVF